MTRRLLIVTQVFLVWGAICLAAGTQDRSDMEVETTVVAVSVLGESYDLQEDLVTVTFSRGTWILLVLESPQGSLTGLATDKCEITKFEDDKGTDLLQRAKPLRLKSKVGSLSAVSADRKALLVDLHSYGVPAEGASELRAEGKLIVSVGSATETAVMHDVPLKPGSRFTAGPIEFHFTAAEQADDVTTLTIELAGDVLSFAAIEFVDDAGRSIELEPALSFRQPNDRKVLALSERVAAATIRVQYWKERREVVVPFAVRTGLGLDQGERAEARAWQE